MHENPLSLSVLKFQSYYLFNRQWAQLHTVSLSNWDWWHQHVRHCINGLLVVPLREFWGHHVGHKLNIMNSDTPRKWGKYSALHSEEDNCRLWAGLPVIKQNLHISGHFGCKSGITEKCTILAPTHYTPSQSSEFSPSYLQMELTPRWDLQDLSVQVPRLWSHPSPSPI